MATTKPKRSAVEKFMKKGIVKAGNPDKNFYKMIVIPTTTGPMASIK